MAYIAAETATHGTMIIRAPGYPPGRTAALTEFVDLYPTLADLAGMENTTACPSNSSSIDV